MILLALVGTAACNPASGESASAPPLNLFDDLDAARLGGLAARLVANPPAARERTILHLDFEVEGIEALVPFGGFGSGANTAEGDAGEPRGGLGIEHGRLHLSGARSGGVSARSLPIPLSPNAVYWLRYHVETRGIRLQKRAQQGGASVLLYRLNSEESSRALELLSDEEFERRARVAASPASFWVPSYGGNQPRTAVEDAFWIPADPLDRLSAERFVERHLIKPAGPSLHVVAAKLRAPLTEEASVWNGNLPADS